MREGPENKPLRVPDVIDAPASTGKKRRDFSVEKKSPLMKDLEQVGSDIEDLSRGIDDLKEIEGIEEAEMLLNEISELPDEIQEAKNLESLLKGLLKLGDGKNFAVKGRFVNISDIADFVYRTTPENFEDEVKQSKEALDLIPGFEEKVRELADSGALWDKESVEWGGFARHNRDPQETVYKTPEDKPETVADGVRKSRARQEAETSQQINEMKTRSQQEEGRFSMDDDARQIAANLQKQNAEAVSGKKKKRGWFRSFVSSVFGKKAERQAELNVGDTVRAKETGRLYTVEYFTPKGLLTVAGADGRKLRGISPDRVEKIEKKAEQIKEEKIVQELRPEDEELMIGDLAGQWQGRAEEAKPEAMITQEDVNATSDPEVKDMRELTDSLHEDEVEVEGQSEEISEIWPIEIKAAKNFEDLYDTLHEMNETLTERADKDSHALILDIKEAVESSEDPSNPKTSSVTNKFGIRDKVNELIQVMEEAQRDIVDNADTLEDLEAAIEDEDNRKLFVFSSGGKEYTPEDLIALIHEAEEKGVADALPERFGIREKVKEFVSEE